MSYTILHALSLFKVTTAKSQMIYLTQLSVIQLHKIKAQTNYKIIHTIH